MLHLTTAASERLEIPAHAIIAVMKPAGGGNPSAIIFDMGAGPQADQLSDQYGFVKKLVLDAQALVNPIEVREVAPEGECRLFFARERIVGRREVKPGVGGINATLFVNLLGKVTALQVADTLDEMDGVEPAPALAPPAASLDDLDNPEWTEDDFARAKRGDEIPAHLRAAFPKTSGE